MGNIIKHPWKQLSEMFQFDGVDGSVVVREERRFRVCCHASFVFMLVHVACSVCQKNHVKVRAEPRISPVLTVKQPTSCCVKLLKHSLSLCV